MNRPAQDLEHLISRYLDDECSPDERRALDERLEREPIARALFDEHSSIDREVKHALRSTLGRTETFKRPLPMWERVARGVIIAAAAALALMFWFTPDKPDNAVPTSQNHAAAHGTSWFADWPGAGDTLVEQPTSFDRPQLRVGQPAKEMIVLPGNAPGEFLVIEVDRVLTRTVHIQRDF